MFGNRYLAVDIGNRNTKIVHGEVNRQKLVVYEYVIVDTPENTIKDGKIINTNILAKAITEAVSKYSIKENKLIMNITGTGVITRDIQLPKSTDEEIQKILEFEAQQYFPVDLENYVLDFKVIESVVNAEGTFYKVLLVAVPNKQVEEYMKVPGLLNMKISAIDLPVNCVSKLLIGKDTIGQAVEGIKDMPDDFAIVDIGSETTGVSIFHRGRLRFSRILLSGSSDIDKMISNTYNIDFKEAERRKISIVHISGVEEAGDLQVDADSMTEAIRPAISNIVSDINRFFDFYSTRGTGNKLEKIYLCGGGSKLKGLPGYLSQYFNMPVDYLPIGDKVEYKGKRKQEEFREDFPLLVNAIGAVVR